MAGCFFFFSLRCGCYLQRKLIRFSNDDSRAFEISFSILWFTLSSIFTFFFSLCLFDLCFVSVLSFRLWLEVFLFFFCFHGAPHSLCVTSPPTFSLRLPLFFPLLLFCLLLLFLVFFFVRTQPAMFRCSLLVFFFFLASTTPCWEQGSKRRFPFLLLFLLFLFIFVFICWTRTPVLQFPSVYA